MHMKNKKQIQSDANSEVTSGVRRDSNSQIHDDAGHSSGLDNTKKNLNDIKL
jgi:hypothetical protein